MPYNAGMNRLLPVFLALLFLLPQAAPAQSEDWIGTVPAAEFPDGLDWINTDEPVSLESLRGRIVLLDFWTYGCINCVHVIPDLKALQEKYDEELVVIGVHSAKFTNEAVTDNIRLIAERYGRTEPIVNDGDFDIWRSYGMNAWPGFIVIDPEGRVVGRHSGEGIYPIFDEIFTSMIDTFERRGTLKRQPLEFSAGSVVRPRAALRFPGKVLADGAGERLFIADSSNNRIVVTSLDGEVLHVIGSGTAELRDGTFEEAGFSGPQGMTLNGRGQLIVADTGNHSLRLVDLEARTVVTAAGHGQQQYMFGLQEVNGLTHGLNSPWDVLWHDHLVYVAMAGQHQLWRFDPDSSMLYLHAGSGREELRDGPLRTGGLNQPSGLATDGTYLYIADSEASAIRRADLDPDGQLTTLVGTGLFDFGDVDGTGDQVRLQHPLGVFWQDGLVYLADTYNNSIKQLDPQTREVRRILGEAEAGHGDGSGLHTMFHEPGGLSMLPGWMYVADTNNHAVRVVDMESGEVTTLQLSDPQGLLLRTAAGEPVFDETVEMASLEIRAGESPLTLQLSLPEGYKANHLAPLQVDWAVQAEAGAVVSSDRQTVARPEYPLELTLSSETPLEAGPHLLQVDIAIYYCQEEASQLCLIRQARLEQPLAVLPESDAARSVTLEWQPPALP